MTSLDKAHHPALARAADQGKDLGPHLDELHTGPTRSILLTSVSGISFLVYERRNDATPYPRDRGPLLPCDAEGFSIEA